MLFYCYDKYYYIYLIHYNLQTHLFIGEICNHVDLETVQPWMVARSPVSTLDNLQEIEYPIPATPAHHNLATQGNLFL